MNLVALTALAANVEACIVGRGEGLGVGGSTSIPYPWK